MLVAMTLNPAYLVLELFPAFLLVTATLVVLQELAFLTLTF
jgi:hypothetical protein